MNIEERTIGRVTILDCRTPETFSAEAEAVRSFPAA